MISFSGIDCSGKSTQILHLTNLLRSKGVRHKVIWSRGGYTPGIEFIKRLSRFGTEFSKEERIKHSSKFNENKIKRKGLFLLSLFDLWLYYSVTIRILGIRQLIICDRYIWDTFIDFKLKYPEYDFETWILWKLTIKTMVKPQSSFCFYIPVEESMRRSCLKEEPFPEPIEIRKKRINWYEEGIELKKWEYCINTTEKQDVVFKYIKEKLKIE